MDKDTRKTLETSPLTITELLSKATNEFCLNFCKYAEECEMNMLLDKELRPCPLDIIGG